MNRTNLHFKTPLKDAVSRIRFSPQSNNLLLSSWDSALLLYDVDNLSVKFQTEAGSALLDCCFQSDSVAFSAGSDGFISRYDFDSETRDEIVNHDDLATCVEYSNETCQVISSGWDRKLKLCDTRIIKAQSLLKVEGALVESISVSLFNLMVAAGESVKIYDLRKLDRSVIANECLDVRIKCICAVPSSYEGFGVGTVDGRVMLKVPDHSSSNGIGYTFRCHPLHFKKGKDHLVAVNDIVFNPRMLDVFVTGDNNGHVSAWDARSRRRLFKFAKYPNSVASLAFNKEADILAVASCHTYQEDNEIESSPLVFLERHMEAMMDGESPCKT